MTEDLIALRQMVKLRGIPTERAPEAPMYVVGLHADEPTSHDVVEGRGVGSQPVLYTGCGQPVSFAQVNTVIPWKHAQRFTVACGRCEVVRYRGLSEIAERGTQDTGGTE